MKWFKHYNTASDGHSFQQLISEKDYETIAIYWWILEQLSKFEDRNEGETLGKITLKFSYFKMKLGQNRQRITKVLLKIAKTFKIEVSINFDETVTVFVPKWLELQESRGGKRNANIEQSFVKSGTDIRYKNKDIRYKNKDSSSIEEKEETKQKLTDRSSVSNFNARFDIDVSNWLSVLDEFGLKKKMDLYIGQLKSSFNNPEDLKLFINELSNSKGFKEIINLNLEENIKMFRIEKYTIAALKNEIGVIK